VITTCARASQEQSVSDIVIVIVIVDDSLVQSRDAPSPRRPSPHFERSICLKVTMGSAHALVEAHCVLA
jgi:hypothetical protein